MNWLSYPAAIIQEHPVKAGVVIFFLALFLLATILVLLNQLFS